MSRSIEEEHAAPPVLGQNNDDTLAGLLGYNEAAIRRLRSQKVEHGSEYGKHLHKKL